MSVGRPLRVGFVVHVMQVAGAEVLVRETIRRLDRKIIPTIFCLDRLGVIGEELIAQGVDVVCLNRRPGRDWRVSWRLTKEARRRKLDLIHAHQYSPFFYAAFAKPLLFPRPPKIILTEHGRHYPDVVSPFRRAFNRIVLDRCADAVTACCRFSAEALRDVDGFRGNRIQVIENGIEIANYYPAADKNEQKRKLNLNINKRYLIHVARHHPVKDQATLLRGFAEAAKVISDLDLLMVGNGPLRADLEMLAGSLGVADRVQFLGIRRDIPELLRAADAFILTSVSEGASLTLLEAMATGLPCIVTDVGGNPELVRDNLEGLLFPRGDVKECANAIIRLFNDPKLSITFGQNARQRAITNYNLDRTIENYYSIYCKLIRMD